MSQFDAYRTATPAENLRTILALHSDVLSPAEKRELEDAATLLSETGDAARSAALDDNDRSYAASLADAVEDCRVTCKHEPSGFDLEQQGYHTIIWALRAYAAPSPSGNNGSLK